MRVEFFLNQIISMQLIFFFYLPKASSSIRHQYVYFVRLKYKLTKFQQMKADLSMKGLSEIMEESYKDQLENTKHQLAKLSNEEFLSRYIQLHRKISINNDYRHLLQVPICELYSKFDSNTTQKDQQMRLQIKRSIEEGFNAKPIFYSKDHLRQLANKKMQQKQRQKQKEVLSNSRKQKQKEWYDKLRLSPKIDVQRKQQTTDVRESPIVSLKSSPTKDATTEQSVEDLFRGLDEVGQQRDLTKKRWYAWGERGKIQQKRRILDDWKENHAYMKRLLQSLLEKLKKVIGTVEVFNQIKIADTTTMLSNLNSQSQSRITQQKSLGSTRIERQISAQQKKLIYRFGSWFNKLLLDQRQIQYIETSLS